jgi:fucose permease
MTLEVSKVRGKLRITTAAFFFISGIITATWASRIPEMQKKFGLNDANWGGVLFCFSLGLFSGLFISSWLVARFTSAKTMVIVSFIYALLLCLLPLLPDVYLLMAVLFCFGLTRNVLNIAINTNSIEVQNLYKKPIIANFHGVWSLSCLIAAGVGTLMITNNIIPAIHFIIIAAGVVVMIIFFRIKRSAKKSLPVEKRPLLIKPDRYLFTLGLIAFCILMVEGTIFDWGISYFDKVIHADKKFVTAGYTSFIITMTIGRLIGDKLIAYFGHLKMMMINGILIAIGLTIVIAFPHVWIASFGFLLIGFGDATLFPIIYMLAGQSKIMQPSYAIASVTFVGYIGFLAGPLLVGNISEHFGMQYAFGLMAVCSVLISIITFTIKKNFQNN